MKNKSKSKNKKKIATAKEKNNSFTPALNINTYYGLILDFIVYH